jgi:hypothetical protein
VSGSPAGNSVEVVERRFIADELCQENGGALDRFHRFRPDLEAVTARRQRLSRSTRRSDLRSVLGLSDFLKPKVDQAGRACGTPGSLIPIDKKPV